MGITSSTGSSISMVSSTRDSYIYIYSFSIYFYPKWLTNEEHHKSCCHLTSCSERLLLLISGALQGSVPCVEVLHALSFCLYQFFQRKTNNPTVNSWWWPLTCIFWKNAIEKTTVCLPAFFKISSFVFSRRKKLMQVCNVLRVSK